MITAPHILLVYPRYPVTFWSFSHAVKFLSKKALLPPLGLLTVSSLLPNSWERKLIDLNTDELKNQDINWADYVFLSGMEVQQVSAQEIIWQVKSYGKKIVAGGPMFTISQDRFPEIDHLVLGEAEVTLPAFIADLEQSRAKRQYSSIIRPDLTLSPVPDWDLLAVQRYGMMSLQYSRGCPFDCEFCDIGLLNGKKPRAKKAEQVLRELEFLYQKGWRGPVFVVDDNFIMTSRLLKEELLPALINWMERKKRPFTFLTQVSLNLADDEELMHLMVRAGFDSVFVGIESPEEKSLLECNKVPNKGVDLLVAVRKIQRFGLEVLGGFIVGFDSDSPNIFREQENFIQKSGIVTAMVGLLNAPRGTRLYQRLQAEGRLLSEFSGDNTDFSINFIPKMGIDPLLKGYQGLVCHLYSPPIFYTRLKILLKNLGMPHKTGSVIRLGHIKAFFHALLALGLLGEERWHFVKMLIWTVLRRPRLLHTYVRLAIYGHHFRKIYEVYKVKQP